jgi:hypothetical protein
MVRTRERDELYRIAERFVDAALRRDDSLFTPGTPIWSLEILSSASPVGYRKASHQAESAPFLSASPEMRSPAWAPG